MDAEYSWTDLGNNVETENAQICWTHLDCTKYAQYRRIGKGFKKDFRMGYISKITGEQYF